MEEDILYNKLIKNKKEDLASFMTGYFIDQDDKDIENMLIGLSNK